MRGRPARSRTSGDSYRSEPPALDPPALAARIRSLGEIGDPALVGKLFDLIGETESDRVREAAGMALHKTKGDARNAIITNTAEAFVAIGGAHGTLSEIAFALKRGKRVVCLGSWNVDPALVVVETPEEAVARVLD